MQFNTVRPQVFGIATRPRPRTAFLAAVLAAGASAHAATGLTIVPTFDPTITQDTANASTIEATINQALAEYKSAFTSHDTVNILFKEDQSIGLGQSETYITTLSYTQYLNALKGTKPTANDTTAQAHLPTQANNPVNGSPNITLSLPLARELGFSASSGGQDSTVSLKTSVMNLSRSNIDPNKYDLKATVQHEVDEVLGLGSSLDTNKAPSTTDASPGDLYRYDANGNRSYTVSTSANSYFSIDGTTLLARFNQQPSGDFGDFASQTPLVQNAFASPGTTPNLGVELTALDVVGYTLAPEPGSAGLLCFAGVAALLRRRRRA